MLAARRRARLVSGLRGLGPAGAAAPRARRRRRPTSPRPEQDPDAERCDLCGIAIPERHRHLLHLVERRIVCACESCWACAPAMPSTARPATGRSGCPTSTCPTTSGPASRSRSAWPSSWTRRSPRASSRCTRARRRDRERAALRVLAAHARAQPGARAPRARHRGPDRQPPLRPAGVRDRADRPVLRADRRDQGALGGHLRRRRASSEAVARSSRSCAPRAVAA